MPSLGGWEWVILALIALLLFGGSRLAGVGRNTGRAVREFKEEGAALRCRRAGDPGRPRQPGELAQPGTAGVPTRARAGRGQALIRRWQKASAVASPG